MEHKPKPMVFSMSYESMWSLLDDVSSEDIKMEADELSTKIKEYRKKREEIEKILGNITHKLSVLDKILSNRRTKEIRDNFRLTDEHRVLLSKMKFDKEKNYIPYNNYEEIAKILGWQIPNEYVSYSQSERISRLFEELPLALEELCKYGK